MIQRIALIGFGEAAAAFCRGGETAYDRKTDDPATRAAKQADYAAQCVEGRASAAEALAEADVVLSLVTADQALAAASAYAPHLAPGALWIDLNSTAPETKRAGARAIEAAGGHYVDGAIIAPVHPAGRAAPVLLSGPHAAAGLAALTGIGFANLQIVAGPLGAASAIKMIRSVLVKGLEALTAECAAAAEAAGVSDDVFASLDRSWRNESWRDRTTYNLERMARHGERRAAEMEEVVRTLDALGTGSAMSRATVLCQRERGRIHAALRGARTEQAA